MAIDPATLIVQPADLASRYGLTNPSQDELDRVAEAIWDAQADVEGELNRPLVPEQVTLIEIYPMPGYDLSSWRAWPDGRQFDDDYTPATWVANGTAGAYDVTFKVGLDGPGTPPIVRYVTAHAVRALREDEAYGFPLKRVVTSLSAEGQSITYVARPSADGEVGSLPNIKTLRQFKRRSVFSRARAPISLWPNTGLGYIGRR